MNFEKIKQTLRNTGNALGGEFESKDQKRIKEITEELKRVNATRNNIIGYGAEPGALEGGAGGAYSSDTTSLDKEISTLEAELSALKNKN